MGGGLNHLVRTGCPGFYPRFDERSRLLLRTRRWLPAISGCPSPTDQMIFADMLNERVERAVSIARRVLDLGADLSERFAFPCHLARCELPLRVSRHAPRIEVGLLVAVRTTHGRQAMTVGTALDRRLMEATLFSLARAIAGRMAIHAARMRQHFSELGEY